MSHERGIYGIPRYRPPRDTTFYHVLHGHVPGHQIDFIYAPDVREGELTPTHFSHLARLMKYCEPQPGARHAFAIANLSRDDTQFVPGHGALALLIGLRIEGAVDHTGRKDPPFAHAIAGVDRNFSRGALTEAASTLARHILGDSIPESAAAFYDRYATCVTDAPERVGEMLSSHAAGFDDLPTLPRSHLGCAYRVAEGVEVPKVLIVHDDAPFGVIAEVAAKIAAVLYRSNVRWTQVSTGGERELPGGVTVRFITRQNARAGEDEGLSLELLAIPDDETQLAALLFAATPAIDEADVQALGWREKFAYPPLEARESAPGSVAEAITRVAPLQPTKEVTPENARSATLPPTHRRLSWGRIAAACVVALVAVVVFRARPTDEPSAPVIQVVRSEFKPLPTVSASVSPPPSAEAPPQIAAPSAATALPKAVLPPERGPKVSREKSAPAMAPQPTEPPRSVYDPNPQF